MATLDPLVDAAWVDAHRGDPDLRIVDATVQITPTFQVTSGRPGWERGHIPGAVFADLLEISSPAAPSFTFTMPSAERFAAAMGRLGVGDGTRVVVYDARESMWAARLWWMLRAFGVDDAAVLDGGWTSWQLEGRPICTVPCAYPPAVLTPHPRPDVFVGKQEVLAAIADPTTRIVSALGRKSHRGEINEYGRPGHIPGAANVSAWAILDRKTQRYRPVGELRELFGPLLESPRVITYCGAGIAASSTAFALHLLGHDRISIYDGGMMEWCADTALPLELGA